MSASSSDPKPSAAALGTLYGSSTALIGLAIYQWFELIKIRQGGTSACAVNETVNCATVWNSTFAHVVHEYLGMPVAALGVLWGVVAFALTFLLTQRPENFRAAVKSWAIVGLLSCVTFISASLQAKALCLTCLGTYALTVVYAVGALKLLGGDVIPPLKDLLGGLGWGLVLTVPVFLGLLYPGSKTPTEVASLPRNVEVRDPNDVNAIVDALPEREKLLVSWARDTWKKAPAHDTSMFPVHARKGNPEAPVKLVEFTDILCGHCAKFEVLLSEIDGMAPKGNLSVEPRYYPLDEECNPEIKGSAKDGVRCFGARLQICAQQHPKFFVMRSEFFENQHQLDQGMMISIAQRLGMDTAALQSCIKAPETEARLKEDIAYAKLFNIKGTPLVLLNGREAPPAPVFLLGMAMSGGNADAPFFQRLPPPPTPQQMAE